MTSHHLTHAMTVVSPGDRIWYTEEVSYHPGVPSHRHTHTALVFGFVTEQMKRRTFVATTDGLGTVLLAGCFGSDDGTDDGSTASGTFRLLMASRKRN
ncbi:hypothetical protein HLASF_0519 [Halanaeroarchaeum sulfurireducens]|uniref:Uncharacterized protein n=1 Tax=Halanaeroarchaeum sulfurireducens TaxID=1604004 RepID=A0A0F7PCD6_9EURY|nr:hypothetical protein HLASF_0519 [Halanaeroarchaeum sulfurireducens]ALG81419.1 hypothetical protein HLASA_0516 [Halanaeroarchaeum sulfurireducens]